jgi:hypothetical protein
MTVVVHVSSPKHTKDFDDVLYWEVGVGVGAALKFKWQNF